MFPVLTSHPVDVSHRLSFEPPDEVLSSAAREGTLTGSFRPWRGCSDRGPVAHVVWKMILDHVSQLTRNNLEISLSALVNP